MAETENPKARVLFVDDESAMLFLYELAFQKMRDRWDILFARNGEEALAVMDKAPCQLIVSDMVMPRMSGAQLLAEVMERYPQTTRIILSGSVTHHEVAKCVGAVHQYLLKPCDFPTLKATLERVSALDIFIRNEKIKGLVGQMGVLPSLPALYFQLVQELESPTASLERIGELVARDPSMTAKILQLVNSAFFGISHRITAPAEAVQFLGVGTIRSLALSIHAFACFEQGKMKQFSYDRLWKHSMMTAIFARKIIEGQTVDKTVQEEAFAAALLHDLGKVMMAFNLGDRYGNALALARDKQIPLCEAEREVMEASHADIGAYLLGLWGLPISIVEAVALHHAPRANALESFSPLTAVHVANALQHELDPENEGLVRSSLDEDYLEALDLTEQLPGWRKAVAERHLEAAF